MSKPSVAPSKVANVRPASDSPSAGTWTSSMSGDKPCSPRLIVPATSAPEPPQAASNKPSTSDNIFGGDLISEKSLDEVILAYLSEDLNEK